VRFQRLKNMNTTAVSRSVQVSPRKVRLVADSIKKVSLKKAMHALQLTDKRASYVLLKTLKSAVANAVNNKKLREEDLFIAGIDVLEGSALKRFHPSSRGRVHPYKKRTSHIKITLKGKNE